MKTTISIPDRIAGIIIAAALIVVGVGFMVLGVSFLPVIGILMSIPVLGLAWNFLTPKAIVNSIAELADCREHGIPSWSCVVGREVLTH